MTRWLTCPNPNCRYRVPRRKGYRYCPQGCTAPTPPLKAPWSWVWVLRQQLPRRYIEKCWLWMELHRRTAGATLLLILAVLGTAWAWSALSRPRSRAGAEASLVLYRDGDKPERVPFASKTVVSLQNDDQYGIAVRPAAPYVYVVQQQGEKYWRLFPTSEVQNPVKVGVEYLFPSETTGYYLDGNVGRETIHVVMADDPLADLERLPGPGAVAPSFNPAPTAIGGRLSNGVRLEYTFEHIRADNSHLTR